MEKGWSTFLWLWPLVTQRDVRPAVPASVHWRLRGWGILPRAICWDTNLFPSLCSFTLTLHLIPLPLPHFTIRQTPTWSSVSGPNVPSSRKLSLTSPGRIVSSWFCAPKALRSYACHTVIICLKVSPLYQTVTASWARPCQLNFHVIYLHLFFPDCHLGKCFLRE